MHKLVNCATDSVTDKPFSNAINTALLNYDLL